MELSIIWAAIWGVLFFAVPTLIALGFALVGAVVGEFSNGEAEIGGFIGYLFGWLGAISFMVLAAAQCVTMIINAVNGV